MYSYYVLEHTESVNNNGDTTTDCYVLNDRTDLLAVLGERDVNPALTERCVLRVYASGTPVLTHDFVATLPGDHTGEDEFTVMRPDLAAVTIPDLTAPVLPPGHPIDLDGEPRHFGLTALYC